MNLSKVRLESSLLSSPAGATGTGRKHSNSSRRHVSSVCLYYPPPPPLFAPDKSDPNPDTEREPVIPRPADSYGALAQHQRTGMWLCMSCTRLICFVMGNILEVLRGRDLKAGARLHFLFFFHRRQRHMKYLPVDFTPHPITDPTAAASLPSLLCKAISGGEPITSSQLSLALFCRAQRVLHTVTGARNTGAAHVGNPETFICLQHSAV